MDTIFSLGELFEKVQLQSVFPDGKTFVDCTPKLDLSAIAERYEEQKKEPGFNLAFFVHEYFVAPSSSTTGYVSDASRSLAEHLNLLWDVLTRQPTVTRDSLIDLPHRYIVPGGRFREIYYWDSYFTMLGLRVSGKDTMIQDMVNNFSYLIDLLEYIPNGNRTYFLGRSQPPFFASMVQLLAGVKGPEILREYLPRLEKEYAFWMRGAESLTGAGSSVNRVTKMEDGSLLNHYWDNNDTPRPESYKEDVELARNAGDVAVRYRHLRAAAESGWDFSSRWFKDPADFATIHTTDILPVDLNCLLFHLEQTIAEGFELAGNNPAAEQFIALAAGRKQAIQHYCWNDAKGFYFDYDYVNDAQTEFYHLGAVFPLFFKVASPEQADRVASVIERDFLRPGGVITTTETTNQQWDAPNGWAPLQWITVMGLLHYGHRALAQKIAGRWMAINEKVYHNTGKMMEKYNVVATDLLAGGGEYEAQDGFGWTNGVYLALQDLFAEK